MQYVVLHITFSQPITKITETEKKFKPETTTELKWFLQNCIETGTNLISRTEISLVEVGVFRSGLGHCERKFQTEGRIAHQPPLMSEN